MDFLGANDIIPNKNNQLINKNSINYGNSFFILNNILYHIIEGKIYTTGIKSKKSNCIIEDKILNNQISCDGKFIYFISNKRELKSYSIETKQIKKITENKTDQLFIYSVFMNKNGGEIFNLLNTN